MSHYEAPSFTKWLRSLFEEARAANAPLDEGVVQLKKRLFPGAATADTYESVTKWQRSAYELADKVVVDAKSEAVLLDLCNERNGFIRERALRWLRHARGPSVLAAAVVRLNDFVPQVRDAALDIYLSHLLAKRTDDFWLCLDSICMLEDKTRLNHAVLLSCTADFLAGASYKAEFKPLFLKARSKCARVMLGWILSCWDRGEAVQLAFKHSDPSVRAQGLAAASDLGTEQYMAVIRMGLEDSASSLRATALRLALASELSADEKLELCKVRLLDPNRAVRDTAVWYANRSGFDVVSFFEAAAVRKDLSSSQLLALLFEASSRRLVSAIPLASAALGHRRAIVRVEALKVMLASEPDQQTALLKQAWADPSSKLRGQILSLVGREVVLSGDSLWEMARDAWLRQDIQVASALSDRLGAWGGLVLDLELLSSSVNRERVLRQLVAMNKPQNWLCYSRPYPAEQQRLLTLLEAPALRTELAAFPHVVDGLKKSGCWLGDT